MEKVLKLYTYIDGVNDEPFPNEDEQIELYSFNYDASRMGGAPVITATKKHRLCLDDRWTYNVYAVYRGERYFLKRIPTSSYNNEDYRYKHEIELVSERVILDNVYFYDVVTNDTDNDKYVSNSSSVVFFGDVYEFSKRLNYSLRYAKLQTIDEDGIIDGYNVVVDNGITSEAKLMSFEDQFFSNVLQEIFNVYEIPYYFVGKTIHIGFTSNAITHTFKYGINDALLSITKTNANNKVINRITGVGSSDNIPYYYPNPTESGTLGLVVSDGVTATIRNQEKFNLTAKLSNTFICGNKTSNIEYQQIWSGWNNAEGLVFNDYHVVVEYKLPFNEGKDVSFAFSVAYDKIKDLSVKVKDENSSSVVSDSLTEGFKSGQGSFIVPKDGYLQVDFAISETDYEAAEKISNSISLRCRDINSLAWSLNNKEVNLTDYGIDVTNSVVGGSITYKQEEYIPPQEKLMPPIYRREGGAERFYNAIDNIYTNPQTNERYEFNNPYVEGKPKEHIIEFSDIKPSIVGMNNASGQRMDMFLEFAYDDNDNDETDEEGNYLHPYFFAKLPKFDGEHGFNLFDHSIEEDEMIISMTSGSCGACEWVIGVTDDTQKNIVQVDANGNLRRNSQGDVVRTGTPQDRQNDTKNYEVWIALRKDIDTFGVIMPNAANNYKPSIGDTFVILHIDLPQAYITAAEKKLEDELIKYMAMNNDEKFNFSITFSRIFFAENEAIRKQLDENARLQIEYNGKLHELYVSSYSYKVTDNQALPEVTIELSDTLTISQNPIDTAIGEVKQDIMNSVGSIDWLKLGIAYFLRKDVDDTARGNMTFEKNVTIGGELKSKNFTKGSLTGNGWGAYQDGEYSVIEADSVIARKSLTINELFINQISFTQGQTIFSSAGCEITQVEEYETYYRCYFDNKMGNRFSGFQVNDLARSQRYDKAYHDLTYYYWRKVVGVNGNYIDLSKVLGEYDEGSEAPQVGDNVVQFGNTVNEERQSFIVLDPKDGGRIEVYSGVNSFELTDRNYIGLGTSNKQAYIYGYGKVFFGDRGETSYLRYDEENGLELKGRLSMGSILDNGLTLDETFTNITNDIESNNEIALGNKTIVDGFQIMEGGLHLLQRLLLTNLEGVETGGMVGEASEGEPAFYLGGTLADALQGIASIIMYMNGSAKLGNLRVDEDGNITFVRTDKRNQLYITNGDIDYKVGTETETITTTTIEQNLTIPEWSLGGSSNVDETVLYRDFTAQSVEDGNVLRIDGMKVSASATDTGNANIKVELCVYNGAYSVVSTLADLAASSATSLNVYKIVNKRITSAIAGSKYALKITYSKVGGGGWSISEWKFREEKIRTEQIVTSSEPKVALGQNGMVVSNGIDYHQMLFSGNHLKDIVVAGSYGCSLHPSYGEMRTRDGGSTWRKVPELIIAAQIVHTSATPTINSLYNLSGATLSVSYSATGTYTINYGNIGSYTFGSVINAYNASYGLYGAVTECNPTNATIKVYRSGSLTQPTNVVVFIYVFNPTATSV